MEAKTAGKTQLGSGRIPNEERKMKGSCAEAATEHCSGKFKFFGLKTVLDREREREGEEEEREEEEGEESDCSREKG